MRHLQEGRNRLLQNTQVLHRQSQATSPELLPHDAPTLKVRQYNSTLSRTVRMWGSTFVKKGNAKRATQRSHESRLKNLAGKIKVGKRKKATGKTYSKEAAWRLWQFRCFAAWWENQGYESPLGCLKCGRISGLQADHVIPRSNRLHGDPWNPKNGQLLCLECNYAKGSKHGKDQDFRSLLYREFQAKKAEEEWEYNTVTREWLLKNKSLSSAKTVKEPSSHHDLFIPKSLWRENFKTPLPSAPNVP